MMHTNVCLTLNKEVKELDIVHVQCSTRDMGLLNYERIRRIVSCTEYKED